MKKLSQILDPDYIPIDPQKNAIKTLLNDIGKGDLSPNDTEKLCQTAKCPSLNGFTRIDLIPCGCERIYKGFMNYGGIRQGNYTFNISGIEGVKPCPEHRDLIKGMELPDSRVIEEAQKRLERAE